MEELYGVLDGNDVLRCGAVDQIQHRGERRGLAAPRRSRDEDDAALLARQRPDDIRQPQILEPGNSKRDVAHDQRDRTSLTKRIDPETPHPINFVGEVHLTLFGCFETDDLDRTRNYLAKNEVNRRWSESMSALMKMDVDPNTDFPYLLPLQWRMD